MSSENETQEPMPQLNSPDDLPQLPAFPETRQPPSQAVLRGETERRSSGAQTARRIFVFILRLGLLLVVIAVLVAAYIFGWPIVYAKYVLPVQNNTARMAVLETNQQAGQDQLFALQTQLPGLAASQSDQSAVVTAQAARLDTLEKSLKEQFQALTVSQTEQAAGLTALAPRLSTLESFTKEYSQALAALQSTQTSLQSGDERGVNEMKQQVTLLKSMELLSRARLFLYQSNFGLARQDVQSARDLLGSAQTQPGDSLDKSLAEVLQHLDLALSRLPDFPIAASDDLDIAWQILLGGQAQRVTTPIAPAVNETAPTLTPQAAAQTETPVTTATTAP